MQCRALNDPDSLARLIAELEDTKTTPWREAALVCQSPSVEDPGRKRLWIIPRRPTAGANPRLWIREHQELFDDLVDGNVVHTTIVFPGAWPQTAERHWVNIRQRAPAGRGAGQAVGRQRRIRREVRAVSAPSHLWVDRLRIVDDSGNINEPGRKEGLRIWGGRYWTKEMEDIYVQPHLTVVQDGSSDASEAAKANLLASQPSCLDRGLTVLYGQGGVG